MTAALRAGADVSITARQDPAVKRAIGTVPDDGWTKIKYTNAIYDPNTDTWVSDAEVAEVPFTAFISKPKKDRVQGRLVLRRIPELNAKKLSQPTLFDTHRFHAFFSTSTLDTVTAEQVHRRHAIIEQVHADTKNSALAHLPSGIFTANAAWLVLAVIAFNLTRTAGVLADHGGRLAKATTATIRHTLIHVPRVLPDPPAGSASTSPKHGPGRPRSRGCSRSPTRHPRQQPPDHRRTAWPSREPSGQPGCDARSPHLPRHRPRTRIGTPPPKPGPSVDRGIARDIPRGDQDPLLSAS